jgi:flagellar motor switch protein FliM
MPTAEQRSDPPGWKGERPAAAGRARAEGGDGDALSRLTSSAGLHERLPMLDVVVDRLVRLLTSSIRQFTSQTARVAITDYAVGRFGDMLSALPKPALINVVAAEPWDNKLLIAADSEAIYGLVEVLLGGRQRSHSAERQRSFTSIERRLTQRVLDLVADNLARAFEPIAEVRFHSERLEINPEFVAICRENNPTVVITLRIDFEKLGGIFTIAIPYATLEPVRKLLLQMFMSEKFGRDPVWERHFQTQVQRTELKISGVFHERMITLGEVASWKPGMTIAIPVSVNRPSARLICNGVPLYEGEMGQSNGSLAIRIEAPTNQEQEFIDALISD